MQEFLGEIVGREEVRSPLKTHEGKASFLTTLAIRKEFSFDPGEGGTWVFFGWVCAARDSKLAPRSKKISPKTDCPVLEMGQFFIPRSRIRTKTDTPF